MNTLTCNKCDKEVVDCECPDCDERLARVQSGYPGQLAREAEFERAIRRAATTAPDSMNN